MRGISRRSNSLEAAVAYTDCLATGAAELRGSRPAAFSCPRSLTACGGHDLCGLFCWEGCECSGRRFLFGPTDRHDDCPGCKQAWRAHSRGFMALEFPACVDVLIAGCPAGRVTGVCDSPGCTVLEFWLTYDLSYGSSYTIICRTCGHTKLIHRVSQQRRY